MPFKSEKQRKWMHANEPEMAKKWEKEEAIREKLRKVIRQEIKSVDEGWFDNISQAAQKAYVQKFPNSKFAKNTKKKADDEPSHPDDMDDRDVFQFLNKDEPEDEGPKDNKKTKMSNLSSAVEKTDKLLKKHGAKKQKLDKKISDLAMSIRANDDGTGRYDYAVKDMKKKMKNLESWRSHHQNQAIKSLKANRMAQAKLDDLESKEEKSESIRSMESINEGFDKYYLSSLLDSKLKKKLEIAIKNLKGKIDGVGDDWIWFRMPSHNIDLLAQLIQRLDKNKNVWIGDKRKKNIWDRRRNIDKLGEAQFLKAKQMVFLPDKKMYYDPMNDNLWLMGPYGGPDLDDDPIEPRDRDYKKIIRKLSSKDKSVLKKAMRTRKRRKEATTSVSVPGYLSPQAFKKSTQNAIDVDDEDDEKNESINERKLSSYQKKAILIAIEMSGNMTGAVKKIERIKRGLSNDKKVKDALRLANESMAAPFRRRNSRGLGRPMKVGLSEELQNSQGEQTDFKKGDLVKDINPDCPHHGSEGEVTKVGKGTITFDVTNNGKNYQQGDELEKTVDQMVKLKESVSEGKSKPSKGDYVKTMIGVIAKIEKVRGTIAYMKLQDRKSKGYWINDLKNLKPTDKMEKGKTLWTESVNEDNIKFSKEEMAQLHKDGKVEKGGHTIEFGESVNESDLDMLERSGDYGWDWKNLTVKKGKTVKVTHKKSGKSLIIIDKPNVKREYEKIGYFAEGTVNELSMAPFSSQEARLHIDADIKKMSKELGKTSHDIIKIMMNGVKRGRYTAMDIQRGLKEGPAGRTHFGEMTFIRSLWSKMREKFRRYSKHGKLS
jgi:hypothetical protein